MEFRDLQYLEVLAAELHFGRAAARLYMTQPALSQALARLEKEIGCTLLQRDHRGASLTNAGRVLLSETRGVSKSMSLAAEMARQAGRGDSGSVSVGFLDAAADIIPGLLHDFRARYPAVIISCWQLKSAELARAVETGQIDIAFLRRESSHPDLEFQTLRSEPLCLAVDRGHRLASAKTVTVADLVEEHFLVPSQEGAPSLHGLWQQVISAGGATPRVFVHISSQHVMIDLVAQGVGVAFVAESWIRGNPDIVLKQIRDVHEDLELAVAFRPAQMSSTGRNFLAMARSTFGEFDAEQLSA
jgi:DNA-binding transcriptional LysR family regulator